MKKIIYTALFALLSFNAIQAASAVKIAVIDPQQIMQASSAFAKAKADMQKKFEPQQIALQKTEKSVQAEMAKYKRNASVMTKAQQETAQKKIVTEQNKFMTDKAKFEQDLQAAQKKMLPPLLENIRKTIAKVAKKKGYAVVLQKNTIAYADDKLDITADVIKALK